MPQTNAEHPMGPDRELISQRTFDAPRERVFRAWTEPARLARWWGPKGFRNTFHKFELKPGGNWRFVMHGPDGVDYRNHSVFIEIAEPERIVFDHVSGPHFQVTASFDEAGNKTRLTYRMVFDTPAVCAQLKTFALKSNEENFDRLAAELKRMAQA
ncbi:SRPBCC family protein [Paraburkholderia jirisanensis]